MKSNARVHARHVGFAAALLCAVAPAAAGLPQNAGATPSLLGEGVVSTGDNEFGPALTPDGGTLYFSKTDPGRSNMQVILVTRRTASGWSEPEVAPFSGRYKDLDPSLAPDGSRLVFASNRPPSGTQPKADLDLWMVERSGQGWGEPKHLGALVNSEGSETTTSIAADGTLYLASERPGGKGARDLYRARWADGRYGAAEPLASLNTEFDDSNQFVAPDQSYLIFASGRPGGLGGSDFYVTYQRDGQWTEPKNLGPPINDEASALTPFVTRDGRTLVYASFRSYPYEPVSGAAGHRSLVERFRRPGNGLGDIYQVELKLPPAP
jgi:Tol biopolymer transport system component